MTVRKTKSAKLYPYFYENDFNTASKSVLIGLLNSAASPLFNETDEIKLIFRFSENSDIGKYFGNNLLPRLKFLNTQVFDLKSEPLSGIEFFVVSTKNYSACLMFDFSLGKSSDNNNNALFYNCFNSKKIEEILKILLPQEKFYTDKNENLLLNEAIINLIRFSENSLKEFNINELEKNELAEINQNLKRDEYLAKKSRYISHEIKNHLSIVDVYARIIQKTCIDNNTVENAVEMINGSIKNVTKLLNELKTTSDSDLNLFDLKLVLEETLGSVKEFVKSNEVTLKYEIPEKLTVIIDKYKFQNVILNLIKNAVEAMNEEKKDKFIEVSARLNETTGKISLYIANNGEKIDKSTAEKIFDEGFTTKKTGSGLGLHICRQNLEEMFCTLSLLKSSTALTVFEITLNSVDN